MADTNIVRLPNGQTLNVPVDATPEQVQGWVKQATGQAVGLAQPSAPSDTFEGESGIGALRSLMGQAYTAATQHPMSQWPGDAGNVLRGMYQGQAQETGAEQTAARQSFSQGGAGGIEEGLRHLLGSVPGIGHPLAHGLGNLQQGNFAGAAGDLIALFGGELAKGAVGGLGGAMDRGANVLYRSGVPYPTSMSKEQMVRASDLALDNKIPSGDASIPMGQSGGKTGDLIKSELAQRSQYLTGANGQMPVNMNTVLQEPLDAIVKASADKTPEGLQHVSDMLSELQGWQRAHGPDITVRDAESAKEAMYGRTNPSQYSDSTTPIPGAPKVIKEELARGLKNGIAEVHPMVDVHNQRIQSVIQLQDALKVEAKSRPAVAQTALLWALGPIIGETATALGHSNMGMNGLITLAAAQALKEPAVATRLALAMHDSGGVLQALGKVHGALAAAPQALGQLASRSQSLQPPPSDILQRLVEGAGNAAAHTGAPLVGLNNLLGIPIRQ